MKHKSVSIIGGGIAGLTTAIALKKVGIEAKVFEGAHEIKPVGAGLGLAINAVMAFDELGLKNELIKIGRVLPSFVVKDQYGKPLTKSSNLPFGKNEIVQNITIHRADLHQFLLSHLDENKVILGKRLVNYTELSNAVQLNFDDGTSETSDFVIAADGLKSPIRGQLVPNSLPRYAGYTCWRAVIDNNGLDLKEASETWGGNGRFGIVPLNNNRTYWFACINAPENSPEMKNFNIADLQRHFGKYHDHIPEILTNTKEENLFWNDIQDIQPLKQLAFGKIVLIGDAGHATTPNLGQGACQGIEDAVTLAKCMAQNNDFEQAFERFSQLRIKRTTWIINQSRQMGQMAHITNPILIALRNSMIRLLPQSVSDQQLKKIADVSF